MVLTGSSREPGCFAALGAGLCGTAGLCGGCCGAPRLALTLSSAVCCGQLGRVRTASDPPAFPFFQGTSAWAVTHAHASYVHATKHLAVVPIRGSGPNKVKFGPWPGGAGGAGGLTFTLSLISSPAFFIFLLTVSDFWAWHKFILKIW